MAIKSLSSVVRKLNRISRIFLFSNDGSERFNRHCETLVKHYSHRVLCLKVNSSSYELGNAFFGKEKLVKAMLVTRKEVVLRVLSAMLGVSDNN